MQKKLDKIFLTRNFILFKLSLSPKLLDLIFTLHSEINIFRSGIIAKQSLAQKSIRESLEGIIRVFEWRINQQISEDEFSILYNEWLKSSGTSWTYTTFFHLERVNVYNENEILFLFKKMMNNTNDLAQFITMCITYLNEEYNNYITTTPIIGFDIEGNEISMIDKMIVGLMDEIFVIIDNNITGSLRIDQLFLLFLSILQITEDYMDLKKLPHNKKLNYQQFYSEYFHQKFQNFINHIKCFNGKATRSNFKDYLLLHGWITKERILSLKDCIIDVLDSYSSHMQDFLSKDENILNILKVILMSCIQVHEIKNPAEVNLFQHFAYSNFYKYTHNQNYLIGLKLTNELMLAQEITNEFMNYYGDDFLANVHFTIDPFTFFLTFITKYNEIIPYLLDFAIIKCNLPYYQPLPHSHSHPLLHPHHENPKSTSLFTLSSPSPSLLPSSSSLVLLPSLSMNPLDAVTMDKERKSSSSSSNGMCQDYECYNKPPENKRMSIKNQELQSYSEFIHVKSYDLTGSMNTGVNISEINPICDILDKGTQFDDSSCLIPKNALLGPNNTITSMSKPTKGLLTDDYCLRLPPSIHEGNIHEQESLKAFNSNHDDDSLHDFQPALRRKSSIIGNASNSGHSNSHLGSARPQYLIKNNKVNMSTLDEIKPNVSLSLLNYQSFNPNNEKSLPNLFDFDADYNSNRSIANENKNTRIKTNNHTSGVSKYIDVNDKDRLRVRRTFSLIQNNKDSKSSFVLDLNDSNTDLWTSEKNALLQDIINKKSKLSLIDENIYTLKNTHHQLNPNNDNLHYHPQKQQQPQQQHYPRYLPDNANNNSIGNNNSNGNSHRSGSSNSNSNVIGNIAQGKKPNANHNKSSSMNQYYKSEDQDKIFHLSLTGDNAFNTKPKGNNTNNHNDSSGGNVAIDLDAGHANHNPSGVNPSGANSEKQFHLNLKDFAANDNDDANDNGDGDIDQGEGGDDCFEGFMRCKRLSNSGIGNGDHHGSSSQRKIMNHMGKLNLDNQVNKENKRDHSTSGVNKDKSIMKMSDTSPLKLRVSDMPSSDKNTKKLRSKMPLGKTKLINGSMQKSSPHHSLKQSSTIGNASSGGGVGSTSASGGGGGGNQTARQTTSYNHSLSPTSKTQRVEAFTVVMDRLAKNNTGSLGKRKGNKDNGLRI